jgi:hypothetical protein
MDIAPPVAVVVASPALTVMRPPEVRLPLPTTTLTLPATPLSALPVRNVI